MRDFIVVIGQKSDNELNGNFNVKFYKVRGMSMDEIVQKIKTRISHWSSLHVSAYIMEVIDLEKLSELRREVEFLSSFQMEEPTKKEEFTKGI